MEIRVRTMAEAIYIFTIISTHSPMTPTHIMIIQYMYASHQYTTHPANRDLAQWPHIRDPPRGERRGG